MQKVSRVSMSKRQCNQDAFTLPKPTLSAPTPICPFDFTITSTAFTPIVGVTLNGIGWEVATTSDFLPWSMVASIQTTSEKVSGTIPKKLLQENQTYYVRAYYITDKGDGPYSDVITTVTKFEYIDIPDGENWSDQTNPTNFNWGVFNKIGDIGYYLHHTGTSGDMGLTYHLRRRETSGWGPEQPFLIITENGTEIKTNPGASGPYDSFDITSVTSCTDGTNIFYTITLVNNSEEPYYKGIRLLKVNPAIPEVTTLSTETELFKRDLPAMFHHEGELYFLGGYQINPNGTLITPTEDERTFIKFNLATSTFSEVPVEGSLKPRNYRDSKIVKTANGIYALSGRGNIFQSLDYRMSPELWFFDFTSKTWQPKAMLQALTKIDKGIIAFDMAPAGDALNLVAMDIDQGFIDMWKYWLATGLWEAWGSQSVIFETTDMIERKARAIGLNGSEIIVINDQNEIGM